MAGPDTPAPYPTSQGCAFCTIVRGEAPASIVYEDALSLAFLDHHPLLPGHCLVAPRGHYETLTDLPAGLVPPFFGAVQLLARAVEAGLGADGSFVAINTRISQSVPHLHAHVVPRMKGDGLFARGFIWKRQPYRDQASIAAVRDALRAAVARLHTDASPPDNGPRD